MPGNPISLPSTPRRLLRDETGISAIEFALILPFLLLLYLGSVELTHAITVDRKVTAASSSVGDLVAQVPEVSSGDMHNIFNAASAILAPYGAAPLRIVVSSVEVTDDGPRVSWSSARNGGCHQTGSTLALPAEVAGKDQHVIVAQVEYYYEAALGSLIFDGITLTGTYYLRPRAGSQVKATSELPC